MLRVAEDISVVYVRIGPHIRSFFRVQPMFFRPQYKTLRRQNERRVQRKSGLETRRHVFSTYRSKWILFSEPLCVS